MSSERRESIAPLVRKLEVRLGIDKGALAEGLRNLFEIHGRQWDLESNCRDPLTSLVELGSLKREIDESNARRIEVIRWVDALAIPCAVVADGSQIGIVHWPLTLGQALDQLAISVIRQERVESEENSSQPLLRHQSLAIEDMVEMLVAGQINVPPFSTRKHY
jgi:hypothetical protein